MGANTDRTARGVLPGDRLQPALNRWGQQAGIGIEPAQSTRRLAGWVRHAQGNAVLGLSDRDQVLVGSLKRGEGGGQIGRAATAGVLGQSVDRLKLGIELTQRHS